MKKKSVAGEKGLRKEQLNLIEQFEADFNGIEKFLRKVAGGDRYEPFMRLVNKYLSSHPTWTDAEFLRMAASVRNAIVHGKTEPYRHVAVPTPTTVRNLRACRDRLTNAPGVIPAFQREVESVSVHDDLAKLLGIIKERDYSQFPVYETGGFRGLVTENGITRWLARHVSTELSLVELEDISVKEVLRNEEKRENYRFVRQDVRVDDVRGLFALHDLLEAVLITNSGKKSEPLLGIATRWDIIHLP